MRFFQRYDSPYWYDRAAFADHEDAKKRLALCSADYPWAAYRIVYRKIS